MAFTRELRTFFEAVRVGSIRGASESLGMAPSSVSRQIQLLEHHFGAPLFDRSAQGVVLTHPGRLVAEFARTVLLDHDSLRADINERRGLRIGLIRVAAVESTVSAQVVSAITRFRARFPGVNFELQMVPAPRVIELIKRGDADIGVTFTAAPDTQLQFLARFSEPVVLAVAPHHPLARRERIHMEELTKIPLALPAADFGVRRVIDAVAQARAVTLTPALSSNSFEALKGFARQGGGGTLVPQLTIETERALGLLRAIPIAEPELAATTADVIILASRRPSRLLQHFFEDMELAAKNVTQKPVSFGT